jgi:outer membrane protein OmpA-like peptidoglycan-associated protein
MYKDFDVDANIDDVQYKYEVSLKTSAFGIGPASKISGTIVIENKTDYNKYPKAERWIAPNNKVEYSLDFWNLSLAISLTKWLPKISSKWDVTAEATTSIPYRETDFSGARMDMVEWTAFDISAGIKTGNNKIGVSSGLTKRFLYIVPRGKHELELEGLDTPSLPDTLTIEPGDEDDSMFDFSGPSASFYRGEIDTKKISTDISSLPLPEQFESVYRLQSTRYFKHDDGTLSPAAIEAIGRMCAEELVALTDPGSELEIYGHTDASGKPEHNLTLSAVRAANTMQAIEDRLGKKLLIKVKKVSGLGENEANQKFGQFTEKNAWLRRVVIIINGRAVLSLGQL